MDKNQRVLLVTKYAALTCGVQLLFSFLSPMVGASMGLMQNVFLLIGIVEIVLCCNEYKRKTLEPLSYRESFSLGLQMSFMTGLLYAVVFFVIIKMIEKNDLENFVTQYKSLLVTQGKLDEPTASRVMEIFTNPLFLFMSTIFIYTFLGFFLSLIIAFFVKTSPSSTPNEEQF